MSPISDAKKELGFMTALEIIKELESATSREQGEEILNQNCKRKNDYVEILNCLNIKSNQKNISELKDKILENTVSFRLRSEAIRNYKTGYE